MISGESRLNVYRTLVSIVKGWIRLAGEGRTSVLFV